VVHGFQDGESSELGSVNVGSRPGELIGAVLAASRVARELPHATTVGVGNAWDSGAPEVRLAVGGDAKQEFVVGFDGNAATLSMPADDGPSVEYARFTLGPRSS
jgi:hypothetical protein